MKSVVAVASCVGWVLVAGCSGGGGGGLLPPPQTHAISGVVSGAADVTLSLTGPALVTTTADASGAYSFPDLTNGTYTITPARSGYTFSPASHAVTIRDADVAGQDFTAAPETHRISGTVAGLGLIPVTVSLAGPTSGSTTTGAGGGYAFPNLVDGVYTVTPAASGWTFSPVRVDVALSGANVDGVDFQAVENTYAISGRVSGAVVAGVQMMLRGDRIDVRATDAAGGYRFAGLRNGTYDVLPLMAGYRFSPTDIGVEVHDAEVGGVDFVSAEIPHSISGHVSGVPADVVTLSLRAEAGRLVSSTTPDANGDYTFGDLAGGSYTVTPALRAGSTWFGYWPTPSSRAATVNGADVTAQDFTVAALTCSVDRWCWENPSPQGSPLFGVWGSSDGDLWAVGLDVLLHWNGSAWGGVAHAWADLVTLGPRVWGSAADDVWALGSLHILRWDGSAWSIAIQTPDQPLGIWGSSATDVWVVGRRGTMVHRDGGGWSVSASGISHDLLAVWGASATDVWAVGDLGTMLHWDGVAWTPVASGTTDPLRAVWGSSANDVWAVGDLGTILHWNGVAWSPVASGTTSQLEALWGAAADDVWAAGELGTILHWDGGAWSAVASGTSSGLHAIWGGSARSVWVVGDAGAILHWDGSAWSSARTGAVCGLHGIWGESGDDVWAVGDGGTTLHRSGSAWASVASGTGRGLRAVWGSSPLDVWAVGAAGTILHWNGSAWVLVESGTANDLEGAWGSSAGDVWAVGDLGTMLRWDGSAWSAVESGTAARLAAVWGSSATDVWAVGDDVVLHWDGGAWSTVAAPGWWGWLSAVSGSSADDVWAVGCGPPGPDCSSFASIQHWDGWSWSPLLFGSGPLLGVWSGSANDVWLVGERGTIGHADGTASAAWFANVTWNRLLGVWGASANDVRAVGANGTIVRWYGP